MSDNLIGYDIGIKEDSDIIEVLGTLRAVCPGGYILSQDYGMVLGVVSQENYERAYNTQIVPHSGGSTRIAHTKVPTLPLELSDLFDRAPRLLPDDESEILKARLNSK